MPFCTVLFIRVSWVMNISLPQIVTNVKNAVHGFKKLHGRAFEDPYIQAERAKLPYELQKMPNGSVGVKVSESFGWNLSSGRDMSTLGLCHLTSCVIPVISLRKLNTFLCHSCVSK